MCFPEKNHLKFYVNEVVENILATLTKKACKYLDFNH